MSSRRTHRHAKSGMIFAQCVSSLCTFKNTKVLTTRLSCDAGRVPAVPVAPSAGPSACPDAGPRSRLSAPRTPSGITSAEPRPRPSAPRSQLDPMLRSDLTSLVTVARGRARGAGGPDPRRSVPRTPRSALPSSSLRLCKCAPIGAERDRVRAMRCSSPRLGPC